MIDAEEGEKEYSSRGKKGKRGSVLRDASGSKRRMKKTETRVRERREDGRGMVVGYTESKW